MTAPLRAPEIGRMVEIERELGTLTPRLRELAAAIEAAAKPRDEAMRRYHDADDHHPNRAQLFADFKRADRTWAGAYDVWRAVEEPAAALRDEWLQLQVIRSFFTDCGLCGARVGPVYLEFEKATPPVALCLACLDEWCLDYEPAPGTKPPSHWVDWTAREARERELERRERHERSAKGTCWWCGSDVGDLGSWEPEYADRGEAPSVALKVASLVSMRTTPEVGEVCLLCVDRELELFNRWVDIDRRLVDPAQLRHERALYMFVRDGPARAQRPPTLGPPELPHRRTEGRR